MLDPRERDQRRREQEIAYRRAAEEPVNLALRRESGGTAVVVASAKNNQ
jgi:hypothetical protein